MLNAFHGVVQCQVGGSFNLIQQRNRLEQLQIKFVSEFLFAWIPCTGLSNGNGKWPPAVTGIIKLPMWGESNNANVWSF